MATDPLAAVHRLLAAIESRDLVAVADQLSVDATWANVPHPPAVGREAVIELLAPILTWSDEVRWDVVSAAVGGPGGEVAIVERLDRFVIDGTEHAVACNGVFRVDPDSGTVIEVRDYADLAPWRARIGPVLQARAERPAIDVVERHLAAVDRRDPVAMAADYGLDAVLVRGGEEHRGWRAIARYFATVPERLEGSVLRFDRVETGADGAVEVGWAIGNDGGPVAAGTDHLVVRGGRIVSQRVVLAGDDF